MLHMYACGLERTMSIVPEIVITSFPSATSSLVPPPTIYLAECQDGLCYWVESDTNESDFEDAVAYHKQWHEDGMPE